jgi:dTDP-4-amino-4,6-dideoxygalactose transaminase
MNRDEFIVFGAPLIGEEEIAEVVDTLRSGWIGTGAKVQRFEENLARYLHVPHALAVSSGTAGLHLALDVLGVGAGDEVVTTPMTFAATANVIVHVGATPVFADIDRQTLNLDPAEVERRLTPRSKAIVAVHMAGRPCDVDRLADVAHRHGVALVYDAAHAIEATHDGRSVAQYGDFSVYSFYATKNVTTGEGGAVATVSAQHVDEIAVRRQHGLSRDAWKRYAADGSVHYETLYPGYKYNLTDLEASLGLHQLARIEANWGIRDRHYKRYLEAFADLPELILPREDQRPGLRHARHLFVLLLDLDALSVTRDEFAQALRSVQVGTGVHFTALHLHPFYRECFGFQRGDFPFAEWVGERTMSLPLSAKLTDEQVERVVAAVRRTIGACRRQSVRAAGFNA